MLVPAQAHRWKWLQMDQVRSLQRVSQPCWATEYYLEPQTAFKTGCERLQKCPRRSGELIREKCSVASANHSGRATVQSIGGWKIHPRHFSHVFVMQAVVGRRAFSHICSSEVCDMRFENCAIPNTLVPKGVALPASPVNTTTSTWT